MTYLMSIDGGGTKVLCLITDDNGVVCGSGVGGPANSAFNTKEEVSQSITDAMQQAMSEAPMRGQDISVIYCAMPVERKMARQAILNTIQAQVEICFTGEFNMALYAGIQGDYGALMLAGTGSFAIAKSDTWIQQVGGHGSLIGDEGSGYYIGRRALTACVHMLDGIGADTLLYDKIMHQLHLKGYSSIDQIDDFPVGKQRSFVASICRIVSSCAEHGDAVALSILRDAAEQLAMQMNGLLKNRGSKIDKGFPVTIAGGVWKAHPLLFAIFADSVHKEHPDVNIVLPLFEPVVGGILLGLRDLGHPVKEALTPLKQNLSDFMYHLTQLSN